MSKMITSKTQNSNLEPMAAPVNLTPVQIELVAGGSFVPTAPMPSVPGMGSTSGPFVPRTPSDTPSVK
jgi:hypothetical protein